MTTFTVGTSAVSIQSAKPALPYGSLEHPPLELGARSVLMRAALPNLPNSAVITKAELRFNVHGSWSGSVTMNARRNTSAFTGKTTWGNAPAVAGPTWSKTQTNTADWAPWAIDVTDDVIDFYAGTTKNYGWRLASGDSTFRRIRGAAASSMRPYLWVEYSTKPAKPTNLNPAGGAVDTDKPTLAFLVPEGTTAVQVQIDPDKNGSSPDWASGTTAQTRGTFRLATSTYPGLSNGSQTYWRVRAQTAQGWSPYSSWATFSRVDFGTLDITSPAASTPDATPVVAWTYSGTQQAWRVQVRDSTGKIIEDTGRQPGTATAWQATKSLGDDGDTGQVIVHVWDNTVRADTPGRSGMVIQARNVVVALDGTIAPIDTLSVHQELVRPVVTIQGARAGTLPDELVLMRKDGDHPWRTIKRVASVDVFAGNTFILEDWTAPSLGRSRYRVRPVVNNKVGAGGPIADIYPTCKGLWLVDDNDPDDVETLVVWDTDEGTWSREEFATVHETTDGGLIRRRLAARPYMGASSGTVVEALGFTAEALLATAERFRLADAGTVYRLVAGHLNIPVVAGDVMVQPSPISSNGEVVAHVFWNWWGQD